MIFFLYVLDWNSSLAPIPQRHCFGAHVIIGWVALAGRSVGGAVDVEHWHCVLVEMLVESVFRGICKGAYPL